MPTVRVPVRRTGYRTTVRPGRRYPQRPPPPPAQKSKLLALIGGLGGALLCLLCLAVTGLLGLFASFIGVTAYLGDIYRTFKANNGAATLNVNSLILLSVLAIAAISKLRRAI